MGRRGRSTCKPCAGLLSGREAREQQFRTHYARRGGRKGLALQPEFTVWDALSRGKLVEVLPDWRNPEIHVNVVTPPGALRPLRLKLLLDFLAESLAVAPWAHQAA